jgi:hypothetical protein
MMMMQMHDDDAMAMMHAHEHIMMKPMTLYY